MIHVDTMMSLFQMSDSHSESSISSVDTLQRVVEYGDQLAQDALKILQVNFYTLSIVIAFAAFSTSGLAGEFGFNLQRFTSSEYTLWGMMSWLGSSLVAVVVYYNGRMMSGAHFRESVDETWVEDRPTFIWMSIVSMIMAFYSFAVGAWEGLTGESVELTDALVRLVFASFPIYLILGVFVILFVLPSAVHQAKSRLEEIAKTGMSFIEEDIWPRIIDASARAQTLFSGEE